MSYISHIQPQYSVLK